MERLQLKTKRGGDSRKPRTITTGGQYFPDPDATVERISTGCGLLDCALGGGVAASRMLNLVGDKSTGKTLNAIELSANFAIKYPDGWIRYRDAESAFDVPYARTVGLPGDRVDFGDGESFDTVEDFERDINDFIKRKPMTIPGLYVLDSLDALSDEAEMSHDPDSGKGTYGTGKPKAMSRFFRKLVRRLSRHRVTLVIISQVRDNIGVTFGERHTRSGGKALDFYATQIVWLSQVGSLKKTRNGVERPVGVQIRAKVKKNKAGRPYREAEYPVVFDFGIDDVRAGVEWLHEVKRLGELLEDADDSRDDGDDERPARGRFGKPKPKKGKALSRYLSRLDDLSSDEYRRERRRVGKTVRRVWRELEKEFSPNRSKYGNG